MLRELGSRSRTARQHIERGERVPVRLSPGQRDLVLEHTFIDPELEERLRVAEVEGASIVVRLTLDDLEDFLGHVAAEANHANDAKLRRRLDSLYERLQNVEDSFTDDPSTVHLPRMSLGPRYTPKQGQYLAFIYYYTKINGQAPSEAELQRYFEVSPPSVHRMVLLLEERGLIERTPRESRSIRLLIGRDELPDLE